jgi:hypothetical protein
VDRRGSPLLARVGESFALAIRFHQGLEHAAPLRTGVVGIGTVIGRRLLGSETAEAGLDGPDDALGDYFRREPVKRTLKRVAGIDVLAEDPGFPVLPVNIVPQKQTIHFVNVGVIGEHDVPGHVERKTVVLD